ncbi:uncharacterized protein ACLA_040410 [Aspergillus clavatus NRRL 1]|uniref:Major facilitator superfamily (MFS) profile domain-containing protein n=1 Tax=Aspergillus clavatus (strain ATCC 1007 / CBS 513.65 / DSM 816 / NCTC 3887 / NRRL 1 / QM 1276 / 107) TaxID=344612 RepID=A1CL01_ASPCL|nr:uncharacterized protein ACLA_040410 [Aspergillus clavatus NRRL 1]EAW09825.1 hypothetical protein ACLA_040410 [Aspergillus clavatus NRRL 1]
MDGDWSWRVPLILKALFPAIVCVTIYLLTPESPRYYVMRGKRDTAKQMVAKYHTISGKINEPIVEIVVSQIEASLENNRTNFNQSWDLLTAIGALIVDKFRRRRLILTGPASMIIFQFATTITSWQYKVTESRAAAALTILWIYLYQTSSPP